VGLAAGCGKELMKTCRNILVGLVVLGGFIALFSLARGQLSPSSLQAVAAAQPAPDSIIQLTADALGLLPVDSPPSSGTFWLMTPSGVSAPYPCPPPNDSNWPIFAITDNGNQYLVDGTSGQVALRTQRGGRMTANATVGSALEFQATSVINLVDMIQGAQLRQMMQSMGVGDPSFDNTTTNSESPLDNLIPPPDYGTNLWLSLTVATNLASGIISNSAADIPYELQYTMDLLQPWQSAGWFVYGSELTNWTPFSVPAFSSSNLFLRVRSWQDDGSGLPIWWQMQYFGTNSVDPYGNPAGDGWNNLQKFQTGLNPTNFYTPPSPQNVAVNYNSFNSTATITWVPSPGPVTGYTVEKTDSFIHGGVQTNSISASATSYQDDVSSSVPDAFAGGALDVSYRVQAHYTNGNSSWSGSMPLEQNPVSANIMAGPQGLAYVTTPPLPSGTTALRVTLIDEGAWLYYYWGIADKPVNPTFDIPVSNPAQGQYLIPAWSSQVAEAWQTSFAYVQAVNTSGNISAPAPFNPYSSSQAVPPFFDGRAQLKQNLNFLLRSATVDAPFSYTEMNQQTGGWFVFTNPPNYAYAGFYQLDEIPTWQGTYEEDIGSFDPYWPFEENYRYRNFVLDSTNLDSNGHITTGAGGYYYSYYYTPSGIVSASLLLNDPPTFQFQAPATNGAAIPALLATNKTRWLASYALDSDYSWLWKIGATNYEGVSGMFNNVRNWFGLTNLSANISGTTTLYAGNVTAAGGYFYPETAQPQFQTAEYDFWNRSPVPGMANFVNGQSSDLLIAPVGVPTMVNGYAKLAVLNGYAGVYGYLGQYFDTAYQITNGIVTTNSTGILSPYGNFYATQPGPAALVTMPDIDTGQRGTGTVYCVSLNVDKNHDGVMDLTFNGPDATSQSSPMEFWANNNYDRWKTNSSLLGLLYTDIEQDDQKIGFCPAYPGTLTPDCNYSNVLGNGYAYRAIPCTRDLQDFFRLWVCGVTSNLLAALPTNSTVTLNWGDVGSPNSANPTIDLFQAADPDGGIGYLTNETIAAEQTNYLQYRYVGRLGPGGSIQLNSSFWNGWAGNHFIMCGVNYGTGGLNLTIADGSGNVLAQTTTYLKIVDIKQMYERWTIGDNPNNPPAAVPYPATENLPPFTPAFEYPQPQDTNTTYILHVHGFNMDTWEKDRYAETEFKRLYWQGYKGRFGEFRWPTTTSFYPKTFDDSESNAWASAKGLLNLLTNLNAEYPGHVYLTAHSHGNVVAGEALRLAGNNHVVNTYVAMQGAIASHAYDPTTPVRTLDSTGINLDSGTPNRYAHYYTDSSPCYFNSSAGAGAYVNFYNTNDWALTQLWRPDEDLKPDTGYGWDGTNFYSGTIFHLYLLFPVDTYAIFSYCDEARCQALGAQVNVGGVFSTSRQIDLRQPPYNFGDPHIYHSGEFRSDYAQRWQFWDEVLVQMGLK
jgi:hypothetical protein